VQKVKIGIVGLGTVGMGVLRALRRNRSLIRARCGATVDVRWAAEVDRKRLAACGLPPECCTTDYRALLSDPEVQVVVEVIGGTGVAREVVMAALRAGKHVVTANKALLAKHWQEVFALAHERKCALGFESSVMAGVPVIRGLQEGLAGNAVQSLFGILNGTTNFVLTRMARGLEFDAALAEARVKGLAEADASLDIDGHDAAQKLAILGSIASGKWLPPAEVAREGIGHVEQYDIAEARQQFGYVLRLLAVYKDREDRVEARVHPTFVPVAHPLATIENEYNALLVNADTAGAVTFSGKGAGEKPAASGVVSDIVNILRSLQQGEGKMTYVPMRPSPERAVVIPMDEVQSKFYLRFSVVDRPRVLAFLAGALGERDVSIATCHQRDRSETGGAVPVVVITHAARGGAIREALAEIDGRGDVVKRKTVAIRIEE
jgi:homoserine dehydrogenase